MGNEPDVKTVASLHPKNMGEEPPTTRERSGFPHING